MDFSKIAKKIEEMIKTGIPESRVYTTGSNKAKVDKIIALNIGTHYDNNQDVIDQLGETSTN